MPGFVSGPDGEKVWWMAKRLAKEQYPGLKDKDKDKFYAIVTSIMKNICKSNEYNCGGFGESMSDMLDRLEERAIRIGNPKARKLAVYDIGTRARNFGGELAMKLIDKTEPEGELAANFPKVKQTGNRAVKALEQFSEAVFDTEKYIDIEVQKVRGRLKEEYMAEALSLGGIKATLERGIKKAAEFAKRAGTSVVAGDLKKTLEKLADELDAIADGVSESVLDERSQPKLNKYDPGSLLGWAVHLLDKNGLKDAADEVRRVSKTVSKSWQERER